MVRLWRVLTLIVALVGWATPASPAGSVSVHSFGRYEILLQEDTPVAMGEFLGLVRRQTGLPEYPLMLGADKDRLHLHLLGPGNRPYRLASTEFAWAAVRRAALVRFAVEGSRQEGESVTIRVRHVRRGESIRFDVDLHRLERLLEGQR
jgi:hypothetical protein